MYARSHLLLRLPAQLWLIIGASCALVLLIACEERGGAGTPAARASGTEPAAALASDVHTLRFRIEGMTCQACVQAITKEIRKHETVQTCIVSLKDESAVVVTRSMNDALLIPDAISCLGYEAVLQEQDGEKPAASSEPGAGEAKPETESERG
jgi:copper chaperone CopZ